MRVLHLVGSEEQGGAAQAARTVVGLVVGLVGGEVLQAPRSVWGQAYREIGGYLDPLLAVQLRRRARGYDVVHCHRIGEWGTAALCTGRPTVYSAYDYWSLCPRANLYAGPGQVCDPDRCGCCYRPHGRPWPAVARLALLGRSRRLRRHLRRLDALICLSQDQRRRLAHLEVPAWVIPLPVEVSQVDVDRVPGQVLYLGWMAANKGLDVVLRAWPAVRRALPDACLVIAGPRPHRDYAEHCRSLLSPMYPDVQWLGEVARDLALRLLCEASCVVIPEQWPNPQPLVLCEALALGTPVVASPLGGIPEHGGNRVLYASPTDPEDWARAILLALRRPAPGVYRPHPPDLIRQRLEEVYRCARPSA